MVGDWIRRWEQSRQFRDVANFNVGLYVQQAGSTLDETLFVAGKFAHVLSGNADPKSHMDWMSKLRISSKSDTMPGEWNS